MPESPKILRGARSLLRTMPPEKAVEEAASWGLSPDEELFMWYADDPADFIQDMFAWKDGEGPEPYQLDVARLLGKHHRASVRGPHGLGKSVLMAWHVLWFANTRDGIVDWKIPTTASAYRQLTKFLWPEIHKWAKLLRWDLLGRKPYSRQYELLSHSLKLRDGEAFAASSDDAALIEGAHATELLYAFDEAKRIPGKIFDAAEGAFSNAGPETDNEAYAIAGSTPGEPSGRFHDIQKQRPGFEDWAAGVRHVTLEETIACGRVSRDWAEQRARQWGKNSSIYINRVLGDFASSSTSSVIPSTWIELAQERWLEIFEHYNIHGDTDGPPIWRILKEDQPPLDALGVDVALGGTDDSVFTPRYGNWIRMQRVEPYMDNTTRIGELALSFREKMGGPLNAATIIVDANGPGAGVYNTVADATDWCVAFNGSQRTYFTDKSGELLFKNKRSAAYWNLREILDPETGLDVALPPDEDLLGQLSAPTWSEIGQGLVQVETKKSLIQRTGKSPDKGDSIVLAFWDEGEPTRPKARAVSLIR